MRSGALTVMLVAAEPSGDILGAGLASALRAKHSDGVRFVGVGGPRMAAEGVESPFDIGDLSILGLVEGLRAYPRVKRRVAEAVALAARERPDVAVLIDSWGFTLRVAHGLRRVSPATRLVKYVGPQVWATRPGRARTLARAVDLLLTIHSFDAPWFEREGLRTVFVGNRVLSGGVQAGDGAAFRRSLGAAARDPVLLVLPGSRPAEVERLSDPFRDALARLQRGRPTLKVVVPVAPGVAPLVRARTADWRPEPLLIDEADKPNAFAAANAALACSGTATTELALAGVPMVVAYRVSPITAGLARLLLRTRYITLFNVAAGQAIAPELVQGDCTGPKLAAAVAPLLDDRDRADRQAAAQSAALARMGRADGDPSARAAEAILELLSQPPQPRVSTGR